MKKTPKPADKSVSATEPRSPSGTASDSDVSSGTSSSISSGASPSASTEQPPVPLMPGTEEPRSLGELMREAEAGARDQQSSSDAADVVPGEESHATGSPPAKGGSQRARRTGRPSRAQARRFARERALQALYQWDVSSAQSSTVRQEFLDTQDMSRVDTDYFTLLYNGVTHDPDAVDTVLLDCLDRPISDLDPVERAVLRLAAYELSQQMDIPARVVINEGIEITKRFGADKGHHYVNGVLDKLAMTLRAPEMKAR